MSSDSLFDLTGRVAVVTGGMGQLGQIYLAGLAERGMRVASFDVTMTMTQTIVAGMRLRAKLKGKIDVRPDGSWLLNVDLKGPLEILDRSGNQKGTGDLAVSAHQTYG